jgi:L-alanine-DL-glutamate epimerase-like enolase superfamily enzyme
MSFRIAGIRLHRLRVSERTTWFVVEVATVEGLVGSGECSDIEESDKPSDILAEARDVMPIGTVVDHPADVEADFVWRTRSVGDVRERFARTVVFGAVVAAMCDIAAQLADQPVADWLGGIHQSSIGLYANINRAVSDRTPDRFAAIAAAAVAEGFDQVKVAPFDGPPMPSSTIVDTGLAILDAVRGAIGEEPQLLVDVHTRLDRQELVGAIPVMEELGVAWLEDAVDVQDDSDLSWLASQTAIPLAGGERLTDPEAVAAVCETGHLAHLLLDPKYVGGPLRFRDLLGAVDDRVSLTIHDPTGPISTLTSAHCSMLHPNAGALEYSYGESVDRNRMMAPGERIMNGRLTMPEGSGLGGRIVSGSVRIDRNRLR